jgi:hypothetical protein
MVNYGNSIGISTPGVIALNASGLFVTPTLTQYGVVVAEASNGVAVANPSATVGVPLISQGAAAAPIFGTALIAGGGTSVTSVTTSPTATSFAGWDANSNLSSNNFIEGYATTATAAGTTTLVVGSKELQYFTGSTTQTVKMPVVSTLVLGQTFKIINNSSGVVTVQSSGSNTIQAMAASTVLMVTCILTSGTTAASWNATYASKTLSTGGIATLNGNSGSATGSTVTLTTGASNANGTATFTGSGSTVTLNASPGGTNTGWGANSLALLGAANYNTAFGVDSLKAITTGNYNTAIGTAAGATHTTTDSSNICIGRWASGIAGSSNRLQIGSGNGTGIGNLNKAFIHGIRGITTANADAVAVLVDSAGQLGTVSSSIKYKENVADMRDMKDVVMSLRPVQFNYIEDETKDVKYGLIAEEVGKTFPYLMATDSEKQPFSVKYHELPSILLKQIQAMQKQIDILEAKLSSIG